MGATLKDLLTRRSDTHTSIREAVADVEGVERFRWILRNMVWFGLLVHVMFLGAFIAIGVWPLIVLNVLGVAGYVYAQRLLARGDLDRPLAIGAAEVTVHAVVATIFMGLRAGFFVYIPLLTVLTFLNPRSRIAAKVMWGLAEAVAFMALMAFAEGVHPLVTVGPGTLRGLAVLNGGLLVSTLGFLAHVTNEAVQAAVGALRRALARVDELARTDPLTGLLNRRAMSELMDAEVARVERHGRSFALLVADLDEFKGINDRHGHPVGDHALRAIAQRLLGTVRAQDQVARWGGEEFLLLLPETTMETALEVADRLRRAIAETPLRTAETELHVTGTFGVAVYEQGGSIHDTVRAADRALYAGKAEGKDRVVQGGAPS
ncbi:MAG: GGDEF domain-containing protein [Deinococcales bacterium]